MFINIICACVCVCAEGTQTEFGYLATCPVLILSVVPNHIKNI